LQVIVLASQVGKRQISVTKHFHQKSQLNAFSRRKIWLLSFYPVRTNLCSSQGDLCTSRILATRKGTVNTGGAMRKIVALEYRRVAQVFGKTFFRRRTDLLVILALFTSNRLNSGRK